MREEDSARLLDYSLFFWNLWNLRKKSTSKTFAFITVRLLLLLLLPRLALAAPWPHVPPVAMASAPPGGRRRPVVVNLKICCELGDVPHTSPEIRIRHESCIKNVAPSGRLFQVQTTSEPAAARAISRRTRFEGKASADDEAYSPGSGAVQVSGRWKRAIFCPTTRPVRNTCKSWRETQTAMVHLAMPRRFEARWPCPNPEPPALPDGSSPFSH